MYKRQGRTTVINVIDQNGIERASHKLPYGSQLLVDDGEKVKKNQRLAQWDPYTIPIITEASGIVAFEDLVDGSFNHNSLTFFPSE